MGNCTHFRHPTDEQLRHVDIYFLATKIICSLSTLNTLSYINYDVQINPIVLPYFNYCSIMWGSCGENGAARVITFSSCDIDDQLRDWMKLGGIILRHEGQRN